MILSQLFLNPRNRRVQAELANPYELHRSLMSAFPAKQTLEERVLLYRLETRPTPPYVVVLVQSAAQPDWSALERGDYLIAAAQMKEFSPQFEAGQAFTFRLMANPTRRLKSADAEKPGKRIGLVKEEDQLAWLTRKAQQSGFAVLAAQVTRNSPPDVIKRHPGTETYRMSHVGVRFDGQLRVTDATLFTQTVQVGVGSAKGFGFGLLSLARLDA